MQTNSRWHRGTKAFLNNPQPGVIGKRGEENRSCLHQTYTALGDVAKVKYLHVTKGWREKIDIGFKKYEPRYYRKAERTPEEITEAENAEFLTKMRKLAD